MILRKFTLDDYEELVDMHYEFTKEIYHDRVIGSKYFFYKEVIRWINESKDIVLAEDKDGICGFTLAYTESNGGMTEKVYNGDIAYVKPNKRKGRASYMLYKNVYNFAKENGMKIVSNGRVENGVSDMVAKHFKAVSKFIQMEA